MCVAVRVQVHTPRLGVMWLLFAPCAVLAAVVEASLCFACGSVGLLSLWLGDTLLLCSCRLAVDLYSAGAC